MYDNILYQIEPTHGGALTVAIEIVSALVVLVPEAEVVVKSFRDQYDPSAVDGCPAHITLLYPFKAPGEITSADLVNLRECFRRFQWFTFSLAVTRRFPDVLYFAPEPAEPFRKLTIAIWRLYPNRPPYGGRHPDVVPHLSVARLPDEQLDPIAAELERAGQGHIPISAKVSQITLLDTTSGRWEIREVFDLQGGPG
jgi:2'-5' RNA ligase